MSGWWGEGEGARGRGDAGLIFMEFVFECRHQAVHSMLLEQAAGTFKGILFMEIYPRPPAPPPTTSLGPLSGESRRSIFLMEANDDLGRSLEPPDSASNNNRKLTVPLRTFCRTLLVFCLV